MAWRQAATAWSAGLTVIAGCGARTGPAAPVPGAGRLRAAFPFTRPGSASPIRPSRPSLGPAAAGAAALLLATCGGAPPQRPAAPPPPPVISVEMREFAYERSSDIPSGRVVFRMINAGSVIHQPLLVKLGEDLPPLAEQLSGTERRPVDPFAGTLPRRPGQVGTFAVDLAAGQRYGVICVALDEQGVSHARRGMNFEFRPAEGARSK